jgi:integrase/recombinase XerD
MNARFNPRAEDAQRFQVGPIGPPLIALRLWCRNKTKRVSPQVQRHSTATNLLQQGVDRSVLAACLGHESMDTTQIYLHAILKVKERALAETVPFRGRRGRYRPPDQLLASLQDL